MNTGNVSYYVLPLPYINLFSFVSYIIFIDCQALRALALKYPRKQSVLMSQLADMLRGEGGLPYKEAIATTIITIIEDNPEAKEKGIVVKFSFFLWMQYSDHHISDL